jgi:hypothetical protein
MKPHDGLDSLADFMTEDIIFVSDGTLLAEVIEDCGDSTALAIAFDRITSRLLSDFENNKAVEATDHTAASDIAAATQGSRPDEGVRVDGERGGLAVRLSELVRFLTSQDYNLSFAELQSIVMDSKLRERFETLKTELSSWQLLPIAAASKGAVRERVFAGGNLRLTPSSIQGQVYLSIRLEDLFATTSQLILETTEGHIHKLNLPAPDSGGVVFVVLDLNDDREASVVAALSDPMASGVIVRTAVNEP